MSNHYEVPSWAAKPPTGLHLDVLKVDKLTQKLMIDEKRCHLFGRNAQLNDFSIDHASCSRVHAALVWHGRLARAFLVDLASTHGTFIGSVRLEARKPTQLAVGASFHFGASTRVYTLRERPQPASRPVMDELEESGGAQTDGALLGLPESEHELDNLTEFNTAHNRRIAVVALDQDVSARRLSRSSKRPAVSFASSDQVINPEDIDPSVGRFRNLVSTTVVPGKRSRTDSTLPLSALVSMAGAVTASSRPQHSLIIDTSPALYTGLPPAVSPTTPSAATTPSLGSKLALGVNPAPDVEDQEPHPLPAPDPALVGPVDNPSTVLEPRKKKYAKEMWPGKKTAPSLLV